MPDKTHSRPEPYRMPIARPPRHACGLGCAVFVAFPFFVGTVAIAVLNLVHLEAMISSTLWLAFVGFALWASLDNARPKEVLIRTLSGFSYRQFAEVEPLESDGLSFNLGYVLFGKSFYLLRIPAEDVWWVTWRTGQASAHAGRDVGDWRVLIWYRDDHDPLDHGRNLHMIGFAGAKEPTEAFGRRFVDFLKEGGIELLWDEHEQEFATPNAPSREANRQS